MKVLAIDDEEAVHISLSETLRGQDAELIHSTDRQEAWKILEKSKVDLIFCDIKMKGEEDGIEFLRRLRKDEYFNHIPFIFLSCRSDLKNEALLLGAEHFISKPWDIHLLRQVVASYNRPKKKNP